jgi:hypothetical protein
VSLQLEAGPADIELKRRTACSGCLKPAGFEQKNRKPDRIWLGFFVALLIDPGAAGGHELRVQVSAAAG